MKATATGIELHGFEVDLPSGTYRAGYDPTTTSPSMAVITFLVEIFDSAPTELPLLNDTVDTEALDTLVTTAADRIASGVEIVFDYENYAVTVRSDEIVATPVHRIEEETGCEEPHRADDSADYGDTCA